jgi:hypothetical protein
MYHSITLFQGMAVPVVIAVEHEEKRHQELALQQWSICWPCWAWVAVSAPTHHPQALDLGRVPVRGQQGCTTCTRSRE